MRREENFTSLCKCLRESVKYYASALLYYIFEVISFDHEPNMGVITDKLTYYEDECCNFELKYSRYFGVISGPHEIPHL